MSFLSLLVAVILFIVSAFGVGSKLGFDLVDIGLAFFALAFLLDTPLIKSRTNA